MIRSDFGYQLTYERCDGGRASEFAAAVTPLFLAVPFDTEPEHGMARSCACSGSGIVARDKRRWCWKWPRVLRASRAGARDEVAHNYRRLSSPIGQSEP